MPVKFIETTPQQQQAPSSTGVRLVKNVDAHNERQLFYKSQSNILRFNGNVTADQICKHLNKGKPELALDEVIQKKEIKPVKKNDSKPVQHKRIQSQVESKITIEYFGAI
jgi:hypothetical protein